MEIYKLLSHIMESKNLSIADVARICEIPDSTVRGIITRKQKTVSLDVAFKLSDGLNVSLQYLNGLPDIQTKKAPSYSDEAMKLAYDFDNRIDDWGRKQVRNVTDNEILRYKSELDLIKKKEQPYKIEKSIPLQEQKIIYLPEPLQSASAGTGQIADDDTAEQVAVYYNEKTAKADYIMRVSGDSMEPKFMDGDRVLVRSQPAVEIGEIGIFIVDGEQYVKIYRGSYLESLNPQYNNIEVSERSFCRGKVIGVLEPEWIAE